MKKIILTVFAFLFFVGVVATAFYVVFFRKNTLSLFEKPQESLQNTDQAFPLLAEEIKIRGASIEEIDGLGERTYILRATLTQPLFMTGKFLKGEFTIDGSSTPLYFNLGVSTGQILFGNVNTSASTWKRISAGEVKKLVGENKKIVIYVVIPKNTSQLLPNTQEDVFAKSQQGYYKIIGDIVRGYASTIPQPIEFAINQFGVME